jgi:hypothetical protein
LQAGYEYSGGIGAESELFLPIRKGPSATASVRYRPILSDDFTTQVFGSYIETGSTMRAQIADIGEQWTRRWFAGLQTSFFAGVAVAYSESNGFPRRRTEAIVPTSNFSMQYNFGLYGGRLRTNSLVQIAPIVDRFTGDFDERLQWMIDANWTKYRLSLLANFSGAQSVLPRTVFSNPALLPFNYYAASTSALYRFTREFAVESGLRFAWVRIDGPDPFPVLWSVFVAGQYILSATYL